MRLANFILTYFTIDKQYGYMVGFDTMKEVKKCVKDSADYDYGTPRLFNTNTGKGTYLPRT